MQLTKFSASVPFDAQRTENLGSASVAAISVFLAPLRSSMQDMKVCEAQSSQPQGQQPAVMQLLALR